VGAPEEGAGKVRRPRPMRGGSEESEVDSIAPVVSCSCDRVSRHQPELPLIVR
jgi:hypothetical protein